jgi:kynureninase
MTRAEAVQCDWYDPLASFRGRFSLPDGVIYLDGNSLGPLPRATAERIAAVVRREWGKSLIQSWNDHGWIDLAARVGDKIGRLIGAAPGCTIVADSTSVNLFKLLSAALALRPGRRVILTEAGNFPTDLYIAQGLAELTGCIVRCEADPLAALNDDVAVLLLTHVNYRSGAMHDMASITRRAHDAGALVLWDLSHSVGAVPLSLAADNVDFAVGCGYKYLNGGPGAPAFLSVALRLLPGLRSPLTGWLGHAEPFAFADDYRPASGIARAVVGTPPILSLAALEVGVDLMLEAPADALRVKSAQLTGMFMRLVDGLGFRLLTPTDPARRGSQVAFAHPHGYAIMQAMIERGVIGDFRAPDVLRFGFAPLFLRYADVWDAASALQSVMVSGAWHETRFQQRRVVT